jgi:hypothetical protein
VTPRYAAIIDACALYPAQLRDLLLSMATTDQFSVRWTDQIHDEWIRNLVANGGSPEKLARTRRIMNDAVPDCLVTGYEHLIDGLELPDPGDRHVLAAAIVARVDAIVTTNLKHFPAQILSRYSLEALHPDDFVMYQFDLNPPRYCQAIKEQRARLRKPPITVDQFLESLERLQMPQTVARLKSFDNLI